MGEFKTQQEAAWAGPFGDDWTSRNQASAQVVAGNTALLVRALSRACLREVRSIIEFGANTGANLRALRHLLPNAELAAVEINERALAELRKLSGIEVHLASVLEFPPTRTYDLVLVKALLIHIRGDKLPQAYDVLYRACARYLCLAEYYNPTPVTVPYRGHTDLLSKRNFAGEMLERFSSLRLVDYGFVYRDDPSFPQDDINWFLLEKR